MPGRWSGSSAARGAARAPISTSSSGSARRRSAPTPRRSTRCRTCGSGRSRPPDRIADMPEVTYERLGAAGVVTIDRPERRNAVDPNTADQLLEVYREFEGDDGARVMILTGAGEEAFCAGADL